MLLIDRVQTSDANDRPVRFSNADCDVSCQYDSKGRRYSQKVVRNGQTIRHLRYVYRGYLQIAALDLLNDGELLYSLLWDPSEETATRPLAMLKDGKTYYYAHDFNKNVTELLDDQGRLRATYDYAPFGQVSLNDPDSLGNPVQWSSKVHDPELGLVYYNFRHYNPLDGRWLSRDLIQEQEGINLYGFVSNNTTYYIDFLGNVMIKGTRNNPLGTPAGSNCLGYAMTGNTNTNLEPQNFNITNNFIDAMKNEGWTCSEVKDKSKCKCEEVKILITLYLNKDNNGINPWSNSTFDWSGFSKDENGRDRELITDFHAIRSEKGCTNDYTQIPNAGDSGRASNKNILWNIFTNNPLLCCCKENKR